MYIINHRKDGFFKMHYFNSRIKRTLYKIKRSTLSIKYLVLYVVKMNRTGFIQI